MRRDKLVNNEIFHIFTRSIAGFVIFNNQFEYGRMIRAIQYYQMKKRELTFRMFQQREKHFSGKGNNEESKKIVEIVSFCLMPTHIHFILKQLEDDGIAIFMSNILNSYTRFFNLKHKRKGPLWETRFKNILIKTDSQLLHLTRYIHLNPVTAYLVTKIDDWQASSYLEYTSDEPSKICNFKQILEISPDAYKKFTEDRVSYQRELSKIKKIILE